MFRETASRKRIYLWNGAGSAVYALSSFLLLLVVVRVCGSEEGGVFSIGYAIAQLMLTVGVFEATTFFATDAQNRFTYAQYLGFKIVTCALMVVVSIVYVLSFGYDAHKALVAYSLCAYRLFEALAQYWFAAFQKEERLDIAGFSTVWRSVISIALFVAVLLACGDVVAAMIAATASEAVWIVCYDIPRLRRIRTVGRPDFSPRALGGIFLACLPLFIGSFMSIYLGNVCKYAIDAVGTEHMQTVFNILFMPSFVINLFVNFFIRPSLTTLAALWAGHDARGFARIIVRLLGVVAGMTAAVELACLAVGIPVLELFYGVDLEGCLPALAVLLAGGGLLSASNVFYNALVVIRAQSGVLIGYAVAIAVTSLVASPLVAASGVWGASVAYAASCAVLLAAFGIVFFLFAREKMRYWKHEGKAR